VNEPESAIGIPVEALEDPSRTYEKKIATLLQAAYSRDGDIPAEQEKYRDAVQVLQNGDHYILIIAANAIPRRRRIGAYAVYVVIALAMVAMILVLQFWTRGK